MAWIALVPLFFALSDKTAKERFFTGYIFGLLFFSGILYWLVNVTILGTIALVALLSFFPAIFSLLFPRTEDRACLPAASPRGEPARQGLWTVIIVPSAWVLTEYLRSHFLSGFPWALLGYSQSFNLSIIQIADITGVYGVSFLIVLVNFGAYLTLRREKNRFYALFIIFILFSLSLAYGNNRLNRPYPTQGLKVAVIQGNIPQNLKWDPKYRDYILDKYTLLTKDSLKENPSLVVWPETSVPGYLAEEDDLKARVLALAKENNVYLLAGSLTEKGSKVLNSAILISDQGTILKEYDKIHLVPFGEFIPFGKTFSWMQNFIDKPIGDFGKGSEFTVFKFKLEDLISQKKEIKKITDFHEFSVLICFEDIFPGLSRRFVQKGARFLVNITNDAWFGKTSAPYQHAQCSVFRAIENRVPVVRAANTGLSCLIDHKGRISETVRLGDEEIFVDGYTAGTIEPVFSKTIYTRFGDVFSWVCISLVFLGLIIRKVIK